MANDPERIGLLVWGAYRVISGILFFLLRERLGGGWNGLNLYSRTERVPIMRVASEETLLLIVRKSMPVIFDRVFRVQKTLCIFNNYPHYKHRLFLCVYPCMRYQLCPFTYIGRCSEIFLTNSSVLPLSRI